MLEDREVDVVYISLPNSEHADWAVRAATAIKHVLCEKPLALCAADVDRMATAAAANEVALMEAAMYRYHPQTARVRKLVLDGAIGAVRFVQARFCFTLINDSDIRRDPEKGAGRSGTSAAIRSVCPGQCSTRSPRASAAGSRLALRALT